MPGEIILQPKYERNHWPSMPRPDVSPPEGWSLSLLTAVNRVHNHNQSPDGKNIAFIWDREELSDVYIMPVGGGWPMRITADRPAYQYWWEEIPAWSPDSRWLAFTIGNYVYVTSITEGVPRRISGFTESAFGPVWMPDSKGLIIGIEHGEETRLLLTDRDGSWPTELTVGRGEDSDAQPSPDGHWVAYVHRPLEDLNRMEIHLVDVTTHQSRVLTSIPHTMDWRPRWSPDGKTISFLSQRSGHNEVWMISPSDDGPEQLTHVGRDIDDIEWSPDGNWLAAVVNEDGVFNLGLINSHDGCVTMLKESQGVFARPNWSPSGDFLTVEYSNPILPPDLYSVSINPGSPGPVAEKDMVQLTFSNPPAMANIPQVMPQHVTFRSFGGLEISAMLYKPNKPNRAAIVYPHGGPREQFILDWDPFIQYLAAKGYTFLAINYRGSTGYGSEFEHLNDGDWGGGDVQDCLYAARYLSELDWIDSGRLAIMGQSYGAYLVACCMSRDPDYRYDCGVYMYGDADLINSWALAERNTRLYTEMQMGHPASNWYAFDEGSTFHQINNIRKPVLILHGLEDDVVPPESTEKWVESLRRADKAYEYVLYAGESHGFLKHRNILDAYARIERFLDWHLMPEMG